MQRFVIVHGQIILNQFRHYPNKAVQRAAFTTELKRHMEMRKHHKLYMSKVRLSAHTRAHMLAHTIAHARALTHQTLA